MAIERRLALWRQGDLNMLMKEIRFIQDRFVNSKRARWVEDISRTFAKLVFQGKLTAAIKLLDKENSSGLLNLSDEVLAQLKEKHPVQLSFNLQLYFIRLLVTIDWPAK